MNTELKQIFGDGIRVNGKTVPVAHLRYKGSETTYIVWTITGNSPALCGDDEPIYTTCAVDVDVYSKGNYKDVVTEIKKLMKQNEWIWAEDSSEMYEDDTALYHLCISFEKEGTI